MRAQPKLRATDNHRSSQSAEQARALLPLFHVAVLAVLAPIEALWLAGRLRQQLQTGLRFVGPVRVLFRLK